MTVLIVLFSIVFSYLLGSMNSAITVCKIMQRKDIRDYGSGNAGLTNVLRVFGKPTAAVTLIVDLIKGVAAVTVCRLLAEHFGVVLLDNEMTVRYLAGLFVMLGHVFPVFYGFHGGKGVLLTATTALAIDPVTFGIAFSFFIIPLVIFKYVSLSSIIAAASYPIVTLVTQYMRNYDKPLINAAFALAMGAIIVIKHHDNIKRLLSGSESKLSFKKK